MYIAGGSEVLDQLQSHSKVPEGAQKKGVCIGRVLSLFQKEWF
jgi:hypothetical protein